MVPIFAVGSTVVRSGNIPAKWDYARRTLAYNVEAAVAYREKALLVTDVKQDAFLRKLLMSFPVSFELHRDELFKQASFVAMNFSQFMGVTSPISAGNFDHHNFLDERSLEAYVYIEQDFDVAGDWRELTPVKYLDHPRTSLSACPLYQQSGEAGVAVVAIDFIMLIYMFYRFINEERELSLDQNRSVTAFLQKHVLPKMLYSQIEVSLLNRAHSLVIGKHIPPSKSSGKTPYPQIDVDEHVDRALIEATKGYAQTLNDYETILQNVPAFTATSMREALVLPDMAETYNVEWLLVLARIKAFDFLIAVGGEQGVNANRHVFNRLKRTITAYGVREWIRKKADPVLTSYHLSVIDKVIGICQ